MIMGKGVRPSAVYGLAYRFANENVGLEPTDANLSKALSDAGRPVPFKLLEPVRRAVLEYRRSEEYALWLALPEAVRRSGPPDAA